jgi:hypothetical protein
MRVLVATDLSPAADIALREGAALAAPGGALAVVHALAPLTEFWLPNFAGHLAKITERASESLTQRVRSVLGPQPVELFVEDDVDYAAIIKRAEAWKRSDRGALRRYRASCLASCQGGPTSRRRSSAGREARDVQRSGPLNDARKVSTCSEV